MIVWTIIECVRPRWFRPGMRMSTSGSKPTRNMSGRLDSTCSSFAHALAARYDSDR
jgi:hypothetical protein